MSFDGLEAKLRLLKLENEYHKTTATLYSTGSKLNLIYQSLLKESLNTTTAINEVEQDKERRRQLRQHNETSEQPTTSNHAFPSPSTEQEGSEREDKDSEDNNSSESGEITYNIRRRKRNKLVTPKTKTPATNKKQKSTKNVDTLTPLQGTSDSSNRTKKSNKAITRTNDSKRREIESQNQIKESSIPPTFPLSSNSSHVSLKPFTLVISRIPIGGDVSKRGGGKGSSVSLNQSKVASVVSSSLSDRQGSDSEWEMSSEISIQDYAEDREKNETVRNGSRETTRKINESSKNVGWETEDVSSIIGRRRRKVDQIIILTSDDESEFEEERSKSKEEKKSQTHHPTVMNNRCSLRRKIPVASYREESEDEKESGESSSSFVADDEVHVHVTEKAKDKRVERPRQLKRARAIYDSDSEEILHVDEETENGESVPPLRSKHIVPESDESDSLIPETPQKTTRLTRLNLLRLSSANTNPLHSPPPRRGNDPTASPIPCVSQPLLVTSPHGSPSKHSSPIKRTNKRERQTQSSPIKDQHSSQTEAPSPRMATRSSGEALQEKQNNSPVTKRTTRSCTGIDNECSTAPSSVSCTGGTNSQSDGKGDAARSVTENERNDEEPVSSKELPPPSKHPKKQRKMSRPLPLPLVNQSGLSIMEITSSRISTMGLRRKTLLDSRHNSTTLLYDTYDEGETNTSRASIRVNNSRFVAPKLKLSKKDKALK